MRTRHSLHRVKRKTYYDNKITEIEGKIPSITGLTTTAAHTLLRIRRQTLVIYIKKTNYDAKISDIEKKYFNTCDYNKFLNNTRDAKIKNKKIVNESEISGFANSLKKLGTEAE